MRILHVLVALLLLSGCDAKSGASAPASTTPVAMASSAAAPAAAPTPTEAPAVAAANPEAAAPEAGSGALAQAGGDAGPYPGLDLSRVPADALARMRKLAATELCPCPGQATSLDVCLTKETTSCGLAVYTAAVLLQGIEKQASDIEIADAVQMFLAEARKVHTFDLTDTPCKGPATAPITLVEFSDFECPFCRRMAGVLSQLVEEYGDQIRFCYKQFPLQMHPNAEKASAAALAAHRQGRFWAFHDRVFEGQSQLSSTTRPDALLEQWAEELGLNLDKFRADRSDPVLLAAIARDRREGDAAGVEGTPTLYLNGSRMLDDFTLESLRAAIRMRLPKP